MRNLYHPKHQQRNDESGAPRQNQQTTTDSTTVTRQQIFGPVSKQRVVMSRTRVVMNRFISMISKVKCKKNTERLIPRL